MKTLVVGSGGRESALAWALDRAPSVTEVVVAPGNPGVARFAACEPVADLGPREVVDVARRVTADLVVIGPEAPLVGGMGDALRADGFAVFGPDASAARVEASKSYAKELMGQAGIPTAAWRAFAAVPDAFAYLDEIGPPYVIKADGLAAGKGVVVTEDRGEAMAAVEECLVAKRFGDAGSTVVVEEFLDGEEASVIALTDGRSAAPCEPAQDYKRIGDGDTGPNTGGMGSYSPVPACPPELAEQIVTEIIEPMVSVIAAEGSPFVGALYAGLALTSKGPKVVEFNARFGDPETQALLPRLRSDLGAVARACAEGDLAGARLEWSGDACVSVVLASDGYPGSHETGHPIAGLDEAASVDGVEIFHAGTAERDGRIVTAGGRILAVSALGPGFGEARRRAYEAAAKIDFENKYLRSDIALRTEEYS